VKNKNGNNEKEYLKKNLNIKYVLQVRSERAMWKKWIEGRY